MPLVRIDMIKGKPRKYKTEVLSIVHDCLIDAFGIEEWDRFQRIIEIDKEDFELPEGKTENFMIIDLTIFPGRTREQKRLAIETITESLYKRLGIKNTDVFIIINEPPRENWGLAGKQMG